MNRPSILQICADQSIHGASQPTSQATRLHVSLLRLRFGPLRSPGTVLLPPILVTLSLQRAGTRRARRWGAMMTPHSKREAGNGVVIACFPVLDAGVGKSRCFERAVDDSGTESRVFGMLHSTSYL